MRSKYEIVEQETMGIFDMHELDITGLSNAFDLFAKEVAIEFGRWIDANAINFERTGFTPELFNQFLQEIKQDK